MIKNLDHVRDLSDTLGGHPFPGQMFKVVPCLMCIYLFTIYRDKGSNLEIEICWSETPEPGPGPEPGLGWGPGWGRGRARGNGT